MGRKGKKKIGGVQVNRESRKLPKRISAVFEEHVRTRRKRHTGAARVERELARLREQADELVYRIGKRLGIAEELGELRRTLSAISDLEEALQSRADASIADPPSTGRDYRSPFAVIETEDA